jgi:hypothetical protein
MKNTTYVLIVFGFLALTAIAAASGATSLVTRITCKNIAFGEYNFAIDNSVPKNPHDRWWAGHVLNGTVITPSNSFVWENIEYRVYNASDSKSLKWLIIPLSNAVVQNQEVINLDKCRYIGQDEIKIYRDNTGKPKVFFKSHMFYTHWYHGFKGFVYSFLDPSSARRTRMTCYFENAVGKKAYLEEPKGHIFVRVPYIHKEGNIFKVIWMVIRDVANFSDSSINCEKSIVEVKYGEFDAKKWKWINQKQCFVIDPNHGRKPNEEVQCHDVSNSSIYITNNHIKGFCSLSYAPALSYLFSCDISGTNYVLRKINIDDIQVSALDSSGKIHVITYPIQFNPNAKVKYNIADGNTILFSAVMNDKNSFFAKFNKASRSSKWHVAPANSPIRPYDPFQDAQIVFGGTNDQPYFVYDSLNIYKGNLHMWLNIVPVNELFTEDKN